MPHKFILDRTLAFPNGFDNQLDLNNLGGVVLPQNPQNTPQHFVLVNLAEYQVNKSSGVFKKTASVAAGPNNVKIHRNFRFLPFSPGKITFAPLQGSDILSGKFSGCWMFIFQMGGTDYVGHIGTSDSDHQNLTDQVKDAYRKAIQSNTINSIVAFQPHRNSPIPTPQMIRSGTGTPESFGLVNQNRELTAVVMASPNANKPKKILVSSRVTGIAAPNF